MIKKNNKKDGITQSQTLSIMGIVFLVLFAFIAVPFFNSCRQKSVIAKLKTLNSQLLQANKIYSMQNSVDFNDYDTTIDVTEFAQRYFERYLKIKKTCEGDNQSACWNKVLYKDLKGKKYTNIPEYSIVLADNTVIGFTKNKAGLLSIIADLDGKGGQNRLGRDVFVFYFYNKQSVQQLCEQRSDIYIKDGLHYGGYDECGVPHDEYSYKEVYGKELQDSCNKKSPHNPDGLGVGAACLALIYKSEWSIDKIYPW